MIRVDSGGAATLVASGSTQGTLSTGTFTNGWAGFIDGAIESGLTAGRWLRGQGA